MTHGLVVMGLVVAAGTVAVGPGLAQARPASTSTVRSEIRDGPTPGERHVVVRNNSTEWIEVTRVRLLDCQNVQLGCIDRRVSVRLTPGQEAVLYRARARVPTDPSSFRVSFEYRLVRGQSVPLPASEEREPPPPPPADDPPVAEPAVEPDPAQAAGPDSAVVDSILVTPGAAMVRVGQSIPLGRSFIVRALNPYRQPLHGVRVRVGVEVGTDLIRIADGAIHGLMAGTAVLLFAPPQSEGGIDTSPRGASRVVVRVEP